MRSGTRWGAVFFACIAAPCLLVAGQTQTQKPPIFRATTNIIQTDVTVLDRDGRPVKGLTIDDFELYEDGERVDVLGFAEVNIPDASDGPSWMRDSSPDVRSALNGRVFLFLLDDVQVPYLMTRGRGFVHPEERLDAVKRIAEQFINRMGSEDVAAVICVYDKRCDQDFTNDRGRIRTAVANYNPKSIPPGHGPTPGKLSANMAESIAKYLSGATGRRRTIIYVTPSAPTRPIVWPPPSDGRGNPVMEMEDIQILATFQAAMRAGITVYSLNPNTLLELKDAPPDDPDVPESERSLRFSAPPRSLTAETGGFNITRPDQFADGVAQIFRETGSYYLLGYEPPTKKNTGYNMVGGLRELEIRVKRSELTVKSRRGYITTKADAPPKNPPAASTSALAGVLPKTDLPLRMSIAPFAAAGQPDALVVVTVGISEPDVTASVRDYIDVQVRAFTQSGKELAAVRSRVDARFASSRTGASVTEVVSELRLKPGVYSIRASAYSERMAESGSVYGDVEVPDFGKSPLAMSGVVLMTFPKPESVTPSPLTITLPTVPTTERDFSKSSIARAHVRVYQGGKMPVTPVSIRTTILDEKSKSMLDRTETIDVARFDANRSADVRVDIPVSQLSPGIHRLRIEAFAGAAVAHRDITFRVR